MLPSTDHAAAASLRTSSAGAGIEQRLRGGHFLRVDSFSASGAFDCEAALIDEPTSRPSTTETSTSASAVSWKTRGSLHRRPSPTRAR